MMNKLNIQVIKESSEQVFLYFDFLTERPISFDLNFITKQYSEPLRKNYLSEILASSSPLIQTLPISTSVHVVNNHKHHHQTYKIEFSKIPHYALNWFVYFERFIEDNSCLTITLDSKIIANDCARNDTALTFLAILGKIKTLKDLSLDYQPTLMAMDTLILKVMNNEWSFLYAPIERLKIFYPDVLTNYKRAKCKTNFVLELSKAMTTPHQKEEFYFILNVLNIYTKTTFCKALMGKKAHDGGKYDREYTELNFLRFAEFSIQENGLMCIDLSTNKVYEGHYAPKTRLHAIFYDEMQYLNQYIPWQMQNVELHADKVIVFTLETTEKLKEMGMHINANYFKLLIAVQNKWSFFNHLRLHDAESRFNLLPEEILDSILEESEPNKKHYPGFFEMVNLGKARSKNLDRADAMPLDFYNALFFIGL
jgi:hypothetical protein